MSANKVTVNVTPGYTPHDENGEPYTDGQTIELSKHASEYIQMGLLTPLGASSGSSEGEGSSDPNQIRDIYSAQTVADLKETAEANGLEVPKGAKKADLVDMLVEYEENQAS